MPLPKGIRFRSRQISGGRQRIAFKNNTIFEIVTFKNGREISRKVRVKRSKVGHKEHLREIKRRKPKQL